MVPIGKDSQGMGPGEEARQVDLIPSITVQGLGPQDYAGSLESMCYQVWSSKGPVGIPWVDLVGGPHQMGHAPVSWHHSSSSG